MPTFRLKKLVRDGVFADMQKLGQQTVYKKLEGEECLAALKAKLVEEVNELNPADPKVLHELADLLEVAEAIGRVCGADFDQFRQLQLDRREKAGGFAGGIFVQTLTLAEGDEWAAYYRAEPDRFPEITGEI